MYFRQLCMHYIGQDTGWKKISLSVNLSQLPAVCRSRCWSPGEAGAPRLCVLLEIVKIQAQRTKISLGMYWGHSFCLLCELNQLLLIGSIGSRLNFSLFKINIFHLQIWQILAYKCFQSEKPQDRLGEKVQQCQGRKNIKLLSSFCVSKAVFSPNLTQLYYDQVFISLTMNIEFSNFCLSFKKHLLR